MDKIDLDERSKAVGVLTRLTMLGDKLRQVKIDKPRFIGEEQIPSQYANIWFEVYLTRGDLEFLLGDESEFIAKS